jgi:hypothetical protein
MPPLPPTAPQAEAKPDPVADGGEDQPLDQGEESDE